MRLKGRPVHVLRRRAAAHRTAAQTSHYRLVRNYLEERYHTHFSFGESRWNYAHKVAVKLFEGEKIEDIRTYQEQILKDMKKDLAEIDRLYDEALGKYIDAIRVIKSGKYKLMSEEDLQGLMASISRDMPRVRRRCCCRHRLW